MKAIILAAGKGSRLEKYTKEKPKCLLEFNGKSLLEWQLNTLRDSGIDDIVVVKGYLQEKINFPNVKYYINKDFEDTNMVASLMGAEKELNEEVIVSYSDIIYESRVLQKLMESKDEISVLVDDKWQEYWKSRTKNKMQDIESLQYDNEDNIFDIGNPDCKPDEMKSRYIGLLKFSERGIEDFKRIFYENKEKFWNMDVPWMRSKSFKKAYMTCMLQAMINEGIKTKAVHVENGWLEFDRTEDYEDALNWLKNGSIKRYIKFQR